MAQKEMQRMMQGAVVLTIASFIAKVLSAFYRVPFQNFVGDEGFYVYQQVYPNLWDCDDISIVRLTAIYFQNCC